MASCKKKETKNLPARFMFILYFLVCELFHSIIWINQDKKWGWKIHCSDLVQQFLSSHVLYWHGRSQTNLFATGFSKVKKDLIEIISQRQILMFFK